MSSPNAGKPTISCETKDIVNKEKFEWSINNFKMRLNQGDETVSAVFESDQKMGSNVRFSWRLELSICPPILNPSNDRPTDKFHDWCFLTIWKNTQHPAKRRMNQLPIASTSRPGSIVYEVSLVNGIKKKSGKFSSPYKFELVSKAELLDEANLLLPNDTLTILFEVSTVIKSSTTYKRIQFDLPEPSIFNELSKFLLKKEESFSDVIVEVDGTDLKAHKVILAAHSAVFAVMLKNKSMKEAQNNRIIIKDMDLEVAKQMLEFIYTNKQPSRINEFAHELMAAAHKYEMHRLRLMCEEILFNNVTLDNAVKTLIYANVYGAETLKEATINFMKTNPSVLESTEFKQLGKEIPSLAIEVLCKMRLE